MAVNVNDWMNKPRQIAIDFTDEDAVVTGALRIMSVSCTTASAVGTVIVNDALTVEGGGTTITVACGIQPTHTNTVDFGPQGVRFATGMSLNQSGVGAGGIVSYIVE